MPDEPQPAGTPLIEKVGPLLTLLGAAVLAAIAIDQLRPRRGEERATDDSGD